MDGVFGAVTRFQDFYAAMQHIAAQHHCTFWLVREVVAKVGDRVYPLVRPEL
jgi:hypothetical protein